MFSLSPKAAADVSAISGGEYVVVPRAQTMQHQPGLYGGAPYHRHQMGHTTLLDQKLSEFQGLTPPMFGRALPPSLIESHGELRELPDSGAAAGYMSGALRAGGLPDGSPPPPYGGPLGSPLGMRGRSQNELIVTMHHEGLTNREIADRLGVHYNTVAMRLKILGITSRMKRTPAAQIPATDDIVNLFNQGLSQSNIAKQLGVSQSFISKRLKKRRLEGEKGPDAEKDAAGADDTDETDSKHAMDDGDEDDDDGKVAPTPAPSAAQPGADAHSEGAAESGAMTTESTGNAVNGKVDGGQKPTRSMAMEAAESSQGEGK